MKYTPTWIADHWRSEATSTIKIVDLCHDGRPNNTIATVPYEPGVDFGAALVNARTIAASKDLRNALGALVFHEDCNNEGVSSGAPTSKDWQVAFDNARAVLDYIENGPRK